MIFFYSKCKSRYYKNIPIMAALNIHEDVVSSICELNLSRDSKILDFGCGAGALSERLKDLGFKNIISVDTNSDSFKATTKFYQLDFNDKDAVCKFVKDNFESFDLVLGIEVIEHIENHSEYVRTLKKLVKKDKFMLITTPNINSWLSRFYFLFKGRLLQFGESDILYGHINPIAIWQLRYIFTKENIKTINSKSIGILPMFFLSNFGIKSIMLNFLSLIFTPLMGGGISMVGAF